MSTPPPLPKFLPVERLILAAIISAAIHSMMLLGINYASGSASGFPVALTLAGAAPLQVRIDPEPAAKPLTDDATRPLTRITQDDPATSSSAPLPAGLLPPVMYARAGDLDVKPQIRDRVIPVYPESAANLTGKVIVKVFINARGTVDKVAVVRAEPPGVFDDSAVSAFSAARFTPGMKGHKAVKSLLVLEVDYDSAEHLKSQTGAR